MKTPNQNKTAGFTLLEVLVALAVLALAAAGLLHATGEHVSQAARLEEKTLALTVAQNTIAQLQAGRQWPEPGDSTSNTAMAGRQWNIETHISGTENADMRKIDVSVSLPQHSALITLTGFVGRH